MSTHPRRWFRFSLRTLFVLVVLLAVPLAWLGVQVKWIRDRHAALEWVRQHEQRMAFPSSGAKPLPWSLRVLREKPISYITIWVPKGEKEARLRELERLFPESYILATEGR